MHYSSCSNNRKRNISKQRLSPKSLEMKGTKLYTLLKSFSKEEIKELQKAVKSPIFNTNSTVTRLFERLRYQHPNFDASPKARRKLYKKVFPNNAFNDQKLRRLFTNLSQVIEQFLLLQSLGDNSDRRQQMLVEIYEKRAIVPLFEQETKNLNEKQLIQDIKDADWYLNRFQLLYSQYSSMHHAKYDPNDRTLEEAIHCLDNFFALRKIYLDIGLKNKQKIYNLKEDNNFLPIPNPSQIIDNQLFRMYDLAAKLLSDYDLGIFEEYEKLLRNHVTKLSANDQLLLFFSGLNYLNRKINRGDLHLNDRILDWYKWGLETKILLQNNQLSPITFGNIVVYACQLKDFDWVKIFIKQYQIFLPPGIRDNEAAYSEAILLFFQKSYEKVLSKLSDYVFSHQYKLKTKNLLSRTYFELYLQDFDYHELLFASLKNYENYLYRDEKFKETVIKPHLNFIQILKGLIHKVNTPNAKKETVSWLDSQLKKRTKTVCKNWFLEFGNRYKLGLTTV